jgi:hypothetical protein
MHSLRVGYALIPKAISLGMFRAGRVDRPCPGESWPGHAYSPGTPWTLVNCNQNCNYGSAALVAAGPGVREPAPGWPPGSGPLPIAARAGWPARRAHCTLAGAWRTADHRLIPQVVGHVILHRVLVSMI